MGVADLMGEMSGKFLKAFGSEEAMAALHRRIVGGDEGALDEYHAKIQAYGIVEPTQRREETRAQVMAFSPIAEAIGRPERTKAGAVEQARAAFDALAQAMDAAPASIDAAIIRLATFLQVTLASYRLGVEQETKKRG